MDKKTVNKLRQEYPNHVPLKVAAAFFGVSPRQLSWLVAEGRRAFRFHWSQHRHQTKVHPYLHGAAAPIPEL